MEDIAPGLLETIRKSFAENIESSKGIAALYAKIKGGTAVYADAEEYARLVGEALSQAFGSNLSSSILPDGKMYYNIAERVIRPLMEEDHGIVADAAELVQASLNQKAGIGLAVQKAPINEDRIDVLIDKVSNADSFDDAAHFLGDPIVNFSQNVVDETLRRNVNFQGKAGRHPSIIRKAERKCCKWCSALAGEYEYPDVPDDVYRRHENCNCTVEYDPGDGSRQDVHTKQWTSSKDSDILEARKKVGLKRTIDDLVEHPKKLASQTPESVKEALEADGFETVPLARGSLKGIPFEEGGGYKILFEDGGLFQYHPEQGSHHEGAYYKIATGKGGRHRYDLEGNEID